MIFANGYVGHLFPAHQVSAGLAAADQAQVVSLGQNFRGARARIVIRRLHGAIGAGSPKDQHIVRNHVSKWPILQEAIARFTDWADDIGASERSRSALGAGNGMRRAI